MIKFDSDGAIGRFERWSEGEKQLIHQTSIRILSEIGMHVFHEEARTLLKDAGAAVCGDLVKIPERMVDEALESAPSEYSIYNVDGTEAFCLEPNVITFGTGTDMPEFIDLYSGKIRPGKLADCENAAKIAQHCKSIDWLAPYALANDKNPRVADVYHYKAMRKYCSKPVLTLATDPYSLKGIIDMAATQAGGYKELKAKPTFVHYAEPISPLQHSEESLGKLLLCGEYGIPVTYTAGITAGATGPVTLAGSLAVGSAECLTGLVIHQLKAPGAPFMYGIEASIMDMKTTVCMYGGPEYGLMNSFVGEMGRFYQLPTFGISGATDANQIDFQMGAEMIYSMMTAIFGRQNFVHDNGYMGIGQMGCLQSILAANELLTFVKRYAQSIEITEESICYDLIKKIGIGGNYLQTKDTARKFRKEFFLPEFLNRKRNVAWIADGCPNIPDQLTAKAKEIIEGDVPTFLSDELEAKFDAIIEEHEAHYSA